MHSYTSEQVTCWCLQKRKRERNTFKDFFKPAFSGLSSSKTIEPFIPPADIIIVQSKSKAKENSTIPSKFECKGISKQEKEQTAA